MVVVIPESKLIFIEEPRAGSRTIHQFLILSGLGHSPVPRSHEYRHMSVARFKKEVGQRVSRLGKHKYFAIVRNPFDTVATYYEKVLRAVIQKYRKAELEIGKRTKHGGLALYLETLEQEQPGLLSEKSNLERLKGVDYILHFEDGFPQMVVDFLKEHGTTITPEHLHLLQYHGRTPGKKRDWRQYYDPEGRARRRVEEIYQEYMKLFGYQW